MDSSYSRTILINYKQHIWV